MQKILVWDLPTRFLHWAFAASLTLSLGLAFFADDESVLFQLHMLSGLVAVSVLALRVILGLLGSRYARFDHFPVRPKEVAQYFVGVVTGKARLYVGHNPGSAVAALAMFVLVPTLVITGVSAADASEELHAVLAYVLLGVIAAHLCGLAVHTIRHRENIASSMITGRREGAREDGLRTAHPVWGGILALLGIAWIIALFTNHDAQAATVKLPIVGTIVQLGERENEVGGNHETNRRGTRTGDDRREDDDN